MEVKSFGLDVLSWWELLIKPGIKRLLTKLTKQRKGELNLLMLRQAYLVRKVQSRQQHRQGELFSVQRQIETRLSKNKTSARAED